MLPSNTWPTSGEQLLAQLDVLQRAAADLRPDGFPEDLCVAIEASMAHNPGDRPRSAAEFASCCAMSSAITDNRWRT